MDRNMQNQQGQNKNLGSKDMQDQRDKQKIGQKKQQENLQNKPEKSDEEIGKKPHQPL